jgi:hypothetical protein
MGWRSGFRARGGGTFANFSENLSGGVTGDHGYRYNPAAGGFDFFTADDLVAGPISTFYENIGQKFGDYFAGRTVVENDHGVDTFEGGEDFGALAFGEDRASLAFQLLHAGIAI